MTTFENFAKKLSQATYIKQIFSIIYKIKFKKFATFDNCSSFLVVATKSFDDFL